MCFRQVKGLQNTQPLSYETKDFLSPDTLIASLAYPEKIGQEYKRQIRLQISYDTKKQSIRYFSVCRQEIVCRIVPKLFSIKQKSKFLIDLVLI